MTNRDGKRLLLPVFAIVLILVFILAVGGWYFSPSGHGDMVSVCIGQSSPHASLLIVIAEEQGYFTENGLNVTLKSYDAGRYAVEALTDGEVDIATASELVLTENVLSGEKIQTFACIDKIDNEYIVGRKDHGIYSSSDLSGKEIGITRGTSSEFFLGRYLELHGIPEEDITLVDMRPAQLQDAVIAGDVDAVLVWQPYAFSIEKALGISAMVLPAQCSQSYFWLMITTDDYAGQNPDTLPRRPQSLAQADQYVLGHPSEAKQILGEIIDCDGDDFLHITCQENEYTLSLDQSLIIAMEDETRWLIRNNLTDAESVPNFLPVINTAILREIQPNSVNIFE